ncbi:effector-associated constant component EACC1 [Thioalkalivibrio paradoxus]|uniref:effector-associated constant component EACC1 n=1 Tax=Thioalkalivibrio paradoxus TaxID=108010 RepID=UPI0012EB1C78|nr:hypothetical protein [Thioalkalivibrio paradoxus]
MTENAKITKANLTCFRVSYETLTPILEQHHLHYSRRIQLSEGPMAAGFLVEVSLVGGWGVLAVALLAWMKAKLGRYIKVTKPDGTVIELKGYSTDDAAALLKSAQEIIAIDTNKSSS